MKYKLTNYLSHFLHSLLLLSNIFKFAEFETMHTMPRFINFIALIAIVLVVSFTVSCKKDDGIEPEDPNVVYAEGAVDMGLSVKWRSMNLGANSANEYGDYFAWGEIKPKSSYTWASYKWCEGAKDKLTKYNFDSSWGELDNIHWLEDEDDAAIQILKGGWRMPTVEEVEDLIQKCNWTCTKLKGVIGFRVYSPFTENNLFIPAAGYKAGSDLVCDKEGSYCWTSSQWTADCKFYSLPEEARSLKALKNYRDVSAGFDGRRVGFTIRPVID